MADDDQMVYRLALVLGGETTPKQRERNHQLYQRLRDGVPEEERMGLRGSPLHHMVFEVPTEDVSVSPRGDTLSFRLRPDGECFRRLLSCILDATPHSDPVDDELAATKADLDALKLAAEALQAELDKRGRECNELEAQVERARAKLVEYCTNGEPVSATLEALASFVVGRARDAGDELQALRDLLCPECRGTYACALEDTEGVE